VCAVTSRHSLWVCLTARRSSTKLSSEAMPRRGHFSACVEPL
jgi:hypothetical protein